MRINNLNVTFILDETNKLYSITQNTVTKCLTEQDATAHSVYIKMTKKYKNSPTCQDKKLWKKELTLHTYTVNLKIDFTEKVQNQ